LNSDRPFKVLCNSMLSKLKGNKTLLRRSEEDYKTYFGDYLKDISAINERDSA
jgi:hypothetical protein